MGVTFKYCKDEKHSGKYGKYSILPGHMRSKSKCTNY